MHRHFYFLVLLCVGAPAHSFAASYGPRDHGYWAVDGGAFLSNLNARLNKPTSDVSSLTGYLRVRKGFSLSRKLFLEPSLGTRLPWRTNPDGGASVFTLQFDLDLLFRLLPFLQVKAGPGIHSLLFIGGGGAVALNNGTGTATFYNPKGSALSMDFTMQLGLLFDLSKRVQLGVESSTSNILSSSQRTINLIGTVGLKW